MERSGREAQERAPSGQSQPNAEQFLKPAHAHTQSSPAQPSSHPKASAHRPQHTASPPKVDSTAILAHPVYRRVAVLAVAAVAAAGWAGRRRGAAAVGILEVQAVLPEKGLVAPV